MTKKIDGTIYEWLKPVINERQHPNYTEAYEAFAWYDRNGLFIVQLMVGDIWNL